MKSVLVSAGIAAAAPGYEYKPPAMPAPPAPADKPYDAVVPSDVYGKPSDTAYPVPEPTYDYGDGSLPDGKPSYGGDATVPDDVYGKPSYGGDAVVPDDVYGKPSYGGDAVVPDDVYGKPSYGDATVPDDVDYGYGGDVTPTDVYGDYDDIYDDDIYYDGPYGTDVPYPMPTATQVYDKCVDYDDEDYDDCIVDDEVPDKCVPVTDIVYETVVDGKPSTVCVTKTDTKTVAGKPTTTCVYETVYETEYCDKVTTTETYASDTKTVSAGCVTADPATITIYEFDYDITYVHPTVIETSTTTVKPEDYTDYKYDYVTVTKDVISTDVKYTTETVKETPTVTETEYYGCETIKVYDTKIPEPVYTTVTKTIHIPKGCILDEEVCPTYGKTDMVVPTDVYGDYGYGDDIVPIDVPKDDYGYGGDYPEVVPDDVYGKPSYGGDAVVPDDTYGYDAPAVTKPYDVIEPTDSYGPVDPAPVYDDTYDWSAPDIAMPSY